MQRFEKSKSVIFYDVPENEDTNFDMNYLKQVFEEIPIDLSTMSCKNDGPKKDDKPRLIRVTFQDSSSVKTIFMIKSLLPAVLSERIRPRRKGLF